MGYVIAKDFVDGRALQYIEQDMAQDWQPDRAGQDVEPAECQPDKPDPQGAAGSLVAMREAEENRGHDDGRPEWHEMQQVPEDKAAVDRFFDDACGYRDAVEGSQLAARLRQEVGEVTERSPLLELVVVAKRLRSLPGVIEDATSDNEQDGSDPETGAARLAEPEAGDRAIVNDPDRRQRRQAQPLDGDGLAIETDPIRNLACLDFPDNTAILDKANNRLDREQEEDKNVVWKLH